MLNSQSIFTSKAYYLLLFIIALLFGLFCCQATSPLILKYSIDSSIFISMGRMFVDGLVPYIDFFDHKGPIIIFIQAIGQLIAPYRLGAFVIEVLSLFGFILIADRLVKLFFDDRRFNLCVILLILLYVVDRFQLGSLTEEYSLIPLFGALYIGCRYFFIERKISKLQGFLLGVFFSYLFWLRLNNAGALCGISLFLFISCLIAKNYKSLSNLILFFILGFLPITIGILIYFGYHHAIEDLIYATFSFNFKYTDGQIHFLHSKTWMNIVILLLLSIGSYLCYKKDKDWQIFLFSFMLFVFSYITINVAKLYWHYFTLYLPALAFGLILIFKYWNNAKVFKYIYWITILTFVVYLLVKSISLFRGRDEKISQTELYRSEAIELMNLIPATDLSRTYYYLVETCFYVRMEINSNYKYYIFQEWHGQSDPHIFDEIAEMLVSENRPLWIIMQKSELKAYGLNPQIQTILDRDYHLKAQNGTFILYQLNIP